jgi:anti-sigma factor RsiW
MKNETACEKARRLMPAADTGELDAADSRELDLHLGACAACRRLVAENRLILARYRRLPARRAPVLSVATLEDRTNRRLLSFRAPLILAAIAALLLALLGTGHWLIPLDGLDNPAAPGRTALLDEWQFWMVSSVGHQAETEVALADSWDESEFARHLLVLEGLLPEDELGFDEENPDTTPGELPPISLRDCSRLGLLRS